MKQFPRDMVPADVKQYVATAYPTILEVGCNDGTDTNLLLKEFPCACIYCFEPEPRAIARFKETVHSTRARLIQVAISDRDGTTTFHGSSGKPPNRQRSQNHYCQLAEWDLSGSLCRPTGHLTHSPWVTFPEDRQTEVTTIRLDTWLRFHKEELRLHREGLHIDFIWADVQGAEAMLIAGATETLKQTDYFYTEFYDTPMYEGQPNLEAIRAMLPEFDLITLYGRTNALFQRRQ